MGMGRAHVLPASARPRCRVRPREVGPVVGGEPVCAVEVVAYDFREDPPALVLLDITGDDWTAALYQAPSLTALLEQFPQLGWSFEHGNSTASG